MSGALPRLQRAVRFASPGLAGPGKGPGRPTWCCSVFPGLAWLTALSASQSGFLFSCPGWDYYYKHKCSPMANVPQTCRPAAMNDTENQPLYWNERLGWNFPGCVWGITGKLFPHEGEACVTVSVCFDLHLRSQGRATWLWFWKHVFVPFSLRWTLTPLYWGSVQIASGCRVPWPGGAERPTDTRLSAQLICSNISPSPSLFSLILTETSTRFPLKPVFLWPCVIHVAGCVTQFSVLWCPLEKVLRKEGWVPCEQACGQESLGPEQAFFPWSSLCMSLALSPSWNQTLVQKEDPWHILQDSTSTSLLLFSCYSLHVNDSWVWILQPPLVALWLRLS